MYHTLLSVILNPICLCIYCLGSISITYYLYDKVQIFSMSFKSIYCTFPSPTATSAVSKTLFPKHLIHFLSHTCLPLLLSLCLKCFPNFSSLILLILFLRLNSNIKFSIKTSLSRPNQMLPHSALFG